MRISDIADFLRKSDQLLNINLKEDCVIEGISDDSRKINKNYAFIAIQGLKSDGNDYITETIKKGACLIISNKNVSESKNGNRNIENDTTSFIKVVDSRKTLSLLASYWFGFPAKKLKIIGVTGTKGKTTVVHLIYHIMKKLGYKVGMISTVKAIIGKNIYDTGLHTTNPEPLFLQKLLKEMTDAGLDYAVIEVTSHGLDQERVYGINFCIGVLTNISAEHLDYHKSFKNYRDIKNKLLEKSDKLVLNFDDESFGYLLRKSRNKMRITYSLENDSDVRGQVIKIDGEKMEYSVFSDDKSYSGLVSLAGRYNLYNILATLSAVKLVGINIFDAIRVLKNFSPPEGRLERVNNNRGLNIYIDFAHTPDSLKNLLLLLNDLKKKGNLICIYGCAGERDKKKRFKMGVISGSLADISVITAEDPRSENVIDISRKIIRGVKYSGALEYKGRIERNHNQFVDIPDRNEAIYFAINRLSKRGDTIAVCGKGHEKSMCYGSIEHPWSDRKAILDALSQNEKKQAVILGAGRGKRLNSDIPKVINRLAGKPMIAYTLGNLRQAGFSDIYIVVGIGHKMVEKELGSSVYYTLQKRPLGTANAAWQGIKKLTDKKNPVLVVNGDDSAFYNPKTYREVYLNHKKNQSCITLVTAYLNNPNGMGRIIRDRYGRIVKIIEEDDLVGNEKDIHEVNVGMYVFDPKWFLNNIEKVKKNENGEYFIVDLLEIALKGKYDVNIFKLKNIIEWYGVNTKLQLEGADKKMSYLLTTGSN